MQPTRAGKPIQQSAVKVPPVVNRGKHVNVLAISTGISISQTGIAEEDGAIGDWVRVKPNGGSKTIRALVVGAGQVKLDLGGGR